MSHQCLAQFALGLIRQRPLDDSPRAPRNSLQESYLLLMSLVRMGARRLKEDLAE